MNISVYKRRRLRSTQPILTRVQIRDLGRMRGMTSFRQMVEFFMVRKVDIAKVTHKINKLLKGSIQLF
jgi:hypothetical protein